MLEDGTVFDKRGLDGTDAMEFVTDEGKWVGIIPSILHLGYVFYDSD